MKGIVPEEREDVSRSTYDYRGKMRENREEWVTMGVKQTSSIMMPEKYTAYIRAISTSMTGTYLIEKVEENDDVVISILSNKRMPKSYNQVEIQALSITLLGNDELSKYHKEIKKELGRLEAWALKRIDARLEGDTARRASDHRGMVFNFAYEYAIAYYIMGQFKLMAQIDVIGPEVVLG